LKPERWGSLLLQENNQEEKACDKRWIIIIIIIIIMSLLFMYFSMERLTVDHFIFAQTGIGEPDKLYCIQPEDDYI
jgi:hypothetical protein